VSVTVHQALAAVMAELPSIGKGDKSPEGYAYRGIEAVTKHVQPLFAKHGVVIVPKAGITNVVPSPEMRPGWQDVFMTVEWTVYGPDGSHVVAVTNGIGRDKADKGANKAQTQAFKYLLLHLLCIADGKDDSDSHNYDSDRTEAGELDAAAQTLGFSTHAAQIESFTRLRDRTNALEAEPVKTWVKAQGITNRKLSLRQANDWLGKLDEFSTAAQAASANQPESSGDYDQPVAAVEPDPPATPPAGPSSHDGTEPSPAAAGEGGTQRVRLGSKAKP
jgi:hypothetical protein